MRAWPDLARQVLGARARLATAAQSVRTRQELLLQDILRRHQGSAFGQRHHFANIRTLADYQQQVPAQGYEAYADDMDAMVRGDMPRLVDEPVLAWERTGGSTGGAKLVPLTASGLVAMQHGLYAWLDDLCQAYPAIQAGSSYWSISPAARAPEVTAGGTPVGMASDAGYFGPVAAHLAQVLCVPPAVSALTDIGAWRTITLQALQALLADATLALVSVWSPTFWLELCRHAVLQKEDLVTHIRRGQWAASIPSALEPYLPPPAANPERAARLAQALSTSTPDWPSVWPQLALLSCWTHASSESWAAQLGQLFPHVAVQGKGLLATEGMVSLPIADGADPVAAITSTVLEFEDDAGRAWACDEVETHGEYTVLLTTSAGLYRYRLGDRVRVTGWWHGAPRLRLLGRDTASSDLCGEKLTESFVMQCWRSAAFSVSLGARLVPQTVPSPHYVLVLERSACDDVAARHLASRLDSALRANPQYAYARDLGQLGAIRVRRVDHLAARLQALALAQGQNLGDAKPAVLGRIGELAW